MLTNLIVSYVNAASAPKRKAATSSRGRGFVRKLRHPLSGAIYEEGDGGTVRVTKGDLSGLFSRNGQWLSGDLRSADPEMCRWVTSGANPSPRLRSSRRFTALTSKLAERS
ncbi:MAG: hypothetical protein ACP5P1_03100 [Acidimicrobiales bacterium]